MTSKRMSLKAVVFEAGQTDANLRLENVNGDLIGFPSSKSSPLDHQSLVLQAGALML